MKNNKQIISNWEKQTQKTADAFIDYYFGKDTENFGIVVNDYYFNFREIIDFIKNNYSKKEKFEYYDYILKCSGEKENPVKIRNYCKAK